MDYVLVLHHTKDENVAKRLLQHLRRHDLHVWLVSESIPGLGEGATQQDSRDKAIENASAFVVCLSSSFATSEDQVFADLRAAGSRLAQRRSDSPFLWVAEVEESDAPSIKLHSQYMLADMPRRTLFPRTEYAVQSRKLAQQILDSYPRCCTPEYDRNTRVGTALAFSFIVAAVSSSVAWRFLEDESRLQQLLYAISGSFFIVGVAQLVDLLSSTRRVQELTRRLGRFWGTAIPVVFGLACVLSVATAWFSGTWSSDPPRIPARFVEAKPLADLAITALMDGKPAEGFRLAARDKAIEALILWVAVERYRPQSSPELENAIRTFLAAFQWPDRAIERLWQEVVHLAGATEEK